MSPGRAAALTGAGLVGLLWLAYRPSLDGGFVYDDGRFVASNPALVPLGNPLRFFTDPTTADPAGGHVGIWRPLRTLSFAADRAWFGSDAPWLRRVSVLWHVGAALALFALIGALTGSGLAAAAGAALFGVHPVGVEAVAWISSRDSPMALLFLVLSVVLFRRAGGWALAGAVAAGALAMAAREVAVVLPALLVAHEALGLGRGRRRWARIAPFAALAALYLAGRHAALGDAGGQARAGDRPVVAELATSSAGLLHSAGRLAWPWSFGFDHQLPPAGGFSDPRALGGLALLSGAIALAVVLRRRAPEVAFGIAWALLTWLPVSGVVPLNIATADRFLYVPLAGVALAGGGLLARGAARAGRTGRLVIDCASAGALALLAFTTMSHAAAFRTNETLWSAVLARDPESFRAHHGLGAALHLRGSDEEAERHLRLAAALRPDHPRTFFDLGRLLAGRAPGEAAEALERAVTLWEGRGETAMERDAARAALRLVADLHARAGRAGETLAALERLVRLEPPSAELYADVGALRRRRGDLDGAARSYREALRVRPGFEPAERALRELEGRRP